MEIVININFPLMALFPYNLLLVMNLMI